MARPRTHHDEKKQELIRISFQLFMQNGYENTRIQDIMNAAKISKGAMYHYFASKDEILDAVLNYIIDLDIARVQPVLTDPSLRVLEKLTASMSFEMPQATQEIRQASEYIQQRPASIFDYRARELSRSRSISALSQLIREGIKTGEFHTDYPDEMAAFIYAAAQSMGEMLMCRTEDANPSRTIEAFLRTLTYCLGLEKKGQEYLAEFFKNNINTER